MTSPTGFCCCIFGGNKEVVIVLFAGGVSTAIFFSEGIWGMETVLCDTVVKWMAPCCIFTFIHIINACIPEAKFGP